MTLLDDAASEDVLAEIRERLEADLSDAERREIVQMLVRRITVHTTLPTAAASRSASLSTTASRREARLARASLRVPATISPALSPPELRVPATLTALAHRVRLQGSAPTSPSCG